MDITEYTFLIITIIVVHNNLIFSGTIDNFEEGIKETTIYNCLYSIFCQI